MAEEKNDKQQLTILLPPDEPEKPEPGFIPYAAEAMEAADKKQKRKIVLLVILLVLAIAGFVFAFLAKTQNFYQRTLSSLKFNYLDGEIEGEVDEFSEGELSVALSDQCRGKQVQAEAVLYTFNEEAALLNSLSTYSYSYTPQEQQLNICSGASGWFSKKKSQMRLTAENGFEMKEKGSWTPQQEGSMPLLYDFFFETKSDENKQFQFRGAEKTFIESKPYTLEVWTLCDKSTGKNVYYTLYRYFAGMSLAGVRVLSSEDKLMDVYDVQSYSIS